MHDGIAQVANAPSVVRKAEGYTRRLLKGWRKARYDILILLWVVATAQFDRCQMCLQKITGLVCHIPDNVVLVSRMYLEMLHSRLVQNQLEPWHRYGPHSIITARMLPKVSGSRCKHTAVPPLQLNACLCLALQRHIVEPCHLVWLR